MGKFEHPGGSPGYGGIGWPLGPFAIQKVPLCGTEVWETS